ncbi:MAG: undecaprenyl-phosphate glucose phosphotransferase, partial [Lachnospiraceae bacterium]|nr:undecaprenyl-phosphate glucose phosphotransferase [Lachnospiraceae bacterium]
MIKDNQKSLNRLHIIIDGILIIVAFVLSYELRFHVLTRFSMFALSQNERYYPLAKYAQNLYYLVPAYLVIYANCGLYRPRRSGSRGWLEYWNLFKANILGLLVFATVLYAIRENDISRGLFVTFAMMNFLFGAGFRFGLSRVLRALRKRGFNQKHVLILGYSRT